MTQAERILELLEDRGEEGCTNFELMKISYQYPARIHTLRHKHGHNIKSVHIKDKLWKIYLVSPKEDPAPALKAVPWLED